MRQKTQNGSVLFTTTLILLVIMCMFVVSLNLSRMQWELAVIKKNSSNTYYLAESAARRQVKLMNTFLQSELPRLLEKEIEPSYIKRWLEGKTGIKYDEHQSVFVADESLSEAISKVSYESLKEAYVGKDKIQKYEVQGDRVTSQHVTKVTIEVTDKDELGYSLEKYCLRIKAVAETKAEGKGYDKQCVEALVQLHVPKNINNQIYEKYSWNEGIIPNHLAKALFCCSDMLIKEDGQLHVRGGIDIGEMPWVYEKSSEEEVSYVLTAEETMNETDLRRCLISNRQDGKERKVDREFEEWIDSNSLPNSYYEWRYKTPIKVVDYSNYKVDLEEFFIDEGEGLMPYPTWLINPYQDVTLCIEASGSKDHFVGWIISKGPVQITGDMTITGGMIIGGPNINSGDEGKIDFFNMDSVGLCVEQGKVNVVYDIKALESLMNTPALEQSLQKKLLDALYLTDYSGRRGPSWKDYKKSGHWGAVHYMDESQLVVDMGDIYLEMKSLKQV